MIEELTLARYVRVASVSFGGTPKAPTIQKTVENNLKKMVELLEKAMMDEPDIICFPECSPMLGLSNEEFVKAAEEIPGRIVQTMASLAKKYETYIVCPMTEKKMGKVR